MVKRHSGIDRAERKEMKTREFLKALVYAHFPRRATEVQSETDRGQQRVRAEERKKAEKNVLMTAPARKEVRAKISFPQLQSW